MKDAGTEGNGHSHNLYLPIIPPTHIIKKGVYLKSFKKNYLRKD